MTTLQSIAVVVGWATILAFPAAVLVPAFVRFPFETNRSLAVVTAVFSVGLLSVTVADRLAPSSSSFAWDHYKWALLAGFSLSVLSALPVRLVRMWRGWITPSMNASRIIYTADRIGSSILGATAEDGQLAKRLDVELASDGFRVQVAKQRDTYVAVLTKRGWLAYVSDPASTIDSAASQLASFLASEAGASLR